MRRIGLFLLLALLIGCSKQSEKVTVVFNGEIKNLIGVDSVELKIDNIGEVNALKARIDEKGIFKFVFDLPKASYYSFRCDRNFAELFLSPGDSVFVSFDVLKFDSTIKYSGKGADANNFLIQKRIANKPPDFKEMFSKNEKDFSIFADSVYNSDIKSLEDLANKNKEINKDFFKVTKTKYLYGWATNYQNFPQAHSYYYTNNRDFKPSADFDKYLSKLNLNDTTLLDIPDYSRFLQGLAQSRASEILKNDTLAQNDEGAYTRITLDVISKMFSDATIKEFLTYSILSDNLKYSGIKGIEANIKKFLDETKNSNYKKTLSELLDTWKALAPGTQIPDFTFVDINGKEISLISLKGKYMYIDTWATWCGPCRGEIPSLKKIEEKYKTKNISFVSISIDDDKVAWENMVKTEKLQGIQLYVKGWKNPFTKYFMIMAIPRFILLDKELKIIDANADRPSGKIEETIAKLDGI